MDVTARTFTNCIWADRRSVIDGLWVDRYRSRWYCLALSERMRRAVEVDPARCASCPFWRAGAGHRGEGARDGDFARGVRATHVSLVTPERAECQE